MYMYICDSPIEILNFYAYRGITRKHLCVQRDNEISQAHLLCIQRNALRISYTFLWGCGHDMGICCNWGSHTCKSKTTLTKWKWGSFIVDVVVLINNKMIIRLKFLEHCHSVMHEYETIQVFWEGGGDSRASNPLYKTQLVILTIWSSLLGSKSFEKWQTRM